MSGFANTHPVLTWDGWKRTDELAPGDVVIGAATLPLTGTCTGAQAHDCYAVGAFLGDGGLTQANPTLHLHADEKLCVLAHVTAAVGADPWLRYDGAHGLRAVYPNGANAFLEKYGVERVKSTERRVPEVVYRLGPDAVAACLAGLFDTDGSVYDAGHGFSRVEFATASYALSEDYLTMLNVLGIYATRAERWMTIDGERFRSWRVSFTDADAFDLFVAKAGRHGVHRKKWARLLDRRVPLDPVRRGQFYRRLPYKVWERAYAAVGTRWTDKSLAGLWRLLPFRSDPRRAAQYVRGGIDRRTRVTPDVARVVATYVGDPHLYAVSSGDLVFDEVVAVRAGPPEPTFDLSTDADTQSFLAEHVFTHNTTVLVNMAYGAVSALAGRNVVHYSCEMRKAPVGRRYDDRIAGPQNIKLKRTDPDKYVQIINKRVEQFVHGNLWVQSYPTRTLTPSMIRAHLSILEGESGFWPDVIIADYADIMKPERRLGETRHEVAGIYEDLREIAGEYNATVVTASQAKQSALEREDLTIGDFSEAFEKSAILDGALGLVQTDDMRMEGKCVIKGLAVRGSEDNFTVECQINRRRCYIKTLALYDYAGNRVDTPDADDGDDGFTAPANGAPTPLKEKLVGGQSSRLPKPRPRGPSGGGGGNGKRPKPRTPAPSKRIAP